MLSTEPQTPSVVGGKAAALLELQEAGFRIPETRVSPRDLSQVFDELGTPLAVRSSATVEDGTEISFAGQFESSLGLRTLEEVERAVAGCRASVGAESVLAYCARAGVDPRTIRMEYIVQRMLVPELAGVAFSINPVTGEDDVVIEACEGVGDRLLSGQQQPLPPDHPLLRRHRAEIETTTRRIERHFGCPQDVEFAFQDGLLYLLQARPITRIQFTDSIGEWTNADFRDGGVSSTVCTPLMASLYALVWDRALNGFLREIHLSKRDFQASRMFFGRLYWNLGAVKACLAKLPGFVERQFDDDLAVEPTYEGDGIRCPETPLSVLRVLRSILAIGGVVRRQERAATAMLERGFARIEAKYDPLPRDVESSFRRLIDSDYPAIEGSYFRTIFCASLAKMDFVHSFPNVDHCALVGGLPELRHMAPVREMRAMAARGDSDVARLQRMFRHHSRRELDLRAKRWDEDPSFVEELLEHHRRAPRLAPGSSGRRNPREAYERERQRARASLPRRQRRSFDRKLGRVRRFLWLREEMRDLSTRVYYVIRRHVLEIAAHRGLGDDVFFMSVGEVLRDDRSGLGAARADYERYRNFAAPNEIGAKRRVARANVCSELRGLGASPGEAWGHAHIARSPDGALRAPPGAILVCPFTDPGWTAVLGRVAGVVTETGGMLSHAAVICRELGVPAVLGVQGATRRIQNERAISIDGGRGAVELVD